MTRAAHFLPYVVESDDPARGGAFLEGHFFLIPLDHFRIATGMQPLVVDPRDGGRHIPLRARVQRQDVDEQVGCQIECQIDAAALFVAGALGCCVWLGVLWVLTGFVVGRQP